MIIEVKHHDDYDYGRTTINYSTYLLRFKLSASAIFVFWNKYDYETNIRPARGS